MQKFFLEIVCLNTKVRFEVERKNENFLGQFQFYLDFFKKNCMKIVCLAFFHTFDVGNCMISIFGLWRSTREICF